MAFLCPTDFGNTDGVDRRHTTKADQTTKRRLQYGVCSIRMLLRCLRTRHRQHASTASHIDIVHITDNTHARVHRIGRRDLISFAPVLIQYLQQIIHHSQTHTHAHIGTPCTPSQEHTSSHFTGGSSSIVLKFE